MSEDLYHRPGGRRGRKEGWKISEKAKGSASLNTHVEIPVYGGTMHNAMLYIM